MNQNDNKDRENAGDSELSHTDKQCRPNKSFGDRLSLYPWQIYKTHNLLLFIYLFIYILHNIFFVSVDGRCLVVVVDDDDLYFNHVANALQNWFSFLLKHLFP